MTLAELKTLVASMELDSQPEKVRLQLIAALYAIEMNQPIQQVESSMASDLRTLSDTEVICPNCTHQFRAIPQDVQENLAKWREAYRQMRSVAAGYSNLVAGEHVTRKLDKEFESAEAIARALP